MQKKYQIFVSSTFRDLADERQDAIRSILDLGHIPAGMELFPASDTEQLTYIKKVIDECDYYILIMGGRYGSLDDDGISYTEREYDYAVETGKIVIAFPHGDLASIPVGKSDIGERMRASLEQFRQKVMTGRLVREWNSREQLQSMVVISLVRAIADYPAIGWVRANLVASEDILSQLNTVRADNADLKSELDQQRKLRQPDLQLLAEYDEMINLRYHYTEYHRSGSQKKEGSISLSWREIVIAVCPYFMQPRPRSIIAASIATYLKETKNVDRHITLFSTNVDIVTNQMIALGLINSYQAQALNAGVSEFLDLTELGKKTLLEFTAVKSIKTSKS